MRWLWAGMVVAPCVRVVQRAAACGTTAVTVFQPLTSLHGCSLPCPGAARRQPAAAAQRADDGGGGGGGGLLRAAHGGGTQNAGALTRALWSRPSRQARACGCVPPSGPPWLWRSAHNRPLLRRHARTACLPPAMCLSPFSLAASARATAGPLLYTRSSPAAPLCPAPRCCWCPSRLRTAL